MTMKKVYIEPKCRLMALGEEENLLSGSPTNPNVSEDYAEVDGGGNVNMEGRENIRSRSAWDDEW